MTIASEMDLHFSSIHSRVNDLTIECSGYLGRIDRLRMLANKGGYVDPRTCEATDLRNDIQQIRRISDRLESILNELIANTPAPFMQKVG